jgi:hypothetical protein
MTKTEKIFSSAALNFCQMNFHTNTIPMCKNKGKDHPSSPDAITLRKYSFLIIKTIENNSRFTGKDQDASSSFIMVEIFNQSILQDEHYCCSYDLVIKIRLANNEWSYY